MATFSYGNLMPHFNAPAPTAQGITNSYYDGLNANNKANDWMRNWFLTDRSQNIAQLDKRQNRAMAHLKGTNKANIRSINRDFASKEGELIQQLIGSGRGNASIMEAMQLGVLRQRSDALSGSRAAFGEKMFKAATDNARAVSGLTSQTANHLLSNFNTQAPDAGAFASMLAAAGGAAGGMAGGGGGTMMFDPSRPTGGPAPSWAFDPGSGGQQMAGGMGGFSLADQSRAAAANISPLYAQPSFDFQTPELPQVTPVMPWEF